MAEVWAVGKFRGYLEGRKFKLFTNNSSLQWLNNVSGTKSILMRWALILADFDFEIILVPGTSNQAADNLLRNPGGVITDSYKELQEREIPTASKYPEDHVLLAMQHKGSGIDRELVEKWQTEDVACSRTKEWIAKRSNDHLNIPPQFRMCYKNFRLENGVLMYLLYLPSSSPVVVDPKSQAKMILEKFHDDPEAGLTQVRKKRTHRFGNVSSGSTCANTSRDMFKPAPFVLAQRQTTRRLVEA